MCDWIERNSYFYQISQTVLLLAFLCPTNVHTYCILTQQLLLFLSFLLLAIWAWMAKCVSELFTWNFTFVFINIVQLICTIYRMRKIKFSPDIEAVYMNVFFPLHLNREKFKKIISPDICNVKSLDNEQLYAVENSTKADRLALLIEGSVDVTRKEKKNGYEQLLHKVQAFQFLDSPEYESSQLDRYKVTITASEDCKYLCWQRTDLDYLIVTDRKIAGIMSILIGRDIANKLYSLHEKVRRDVIGVPRLDIRLPAVSTAAMQCYNTHKYEILDDIEDAISGNSKHCSQKSSIVLPYTSPKQSLSVDNKSVDSGESMIITSDNNSGTSSKISCLKSPKLKKIKKELAFDDSAMVGEGEKLLGDGINSG